MKKNFLQVLRSILVIVVMFFGLSACSGGNDEPKKHTITFYVNGGIYDTIDTAGNETLTLPSTPTNETYVFGGWYFDENVWTQELTSTTYASKPLEMDVSVYAKWNVKTVTVSYVTNGGSELAPTTVNLGDFVPWPVTDAPSNDVVFAGWHLKEDLSDEPLTFPYYPQENVTLYADWAETNITIDGFTLAYQFSDTGTSASGYVIQSYTRPENTVGLHFPEEYKNIPLVEIPSDFAMFFLESSVCESITSLIIPDGVERIGRNAFQGFTNLTSLRIGKNVKYIGGGAFQSSYNLADITFGGSLELVGINALSNTAWYSAQADGAIYVDKALVAYKGTVPASVTVREGTVGISDYAFHNQRNLTEIHLPDTVEAIGDYAFYKTGITQIDLPDNLGMLGNYAFAESKLESIVFPEGFAYDEHHTGWKYGLFRLGGNIFNSCTNLTTVQLSEIYEITNGMFEYCTSLTTLTLPASAKNIMDAFTDSGLQQLTILSEEPVQLNANKLPETVTAIYVPAGVKEKMEKLAEEDENYAYYWPEEKLALIIELNA